MCLSLPECVVQSALEDFGEVQDGVCLLLLLLLLYPLKGRTRLERENGGVVHGADQSIHLSNSAYGVEARGT